MNEPVKKCSDDDCNDCNDCDNDEFIDDTEEKPEDVRILETPKNDDEGISKKRFLFIAGLLVIIAVVMTVVDPSVFYEKNKKVDLLKDCDCIREVKLHVRPLQDNEQVKVNVESSELYVHNECVEYCDDRNAVVTKEFDNKDIVEFIFVSNQTKSFPVQSTDYYIKNSSDET